MNTGEIEDILGLSTSEAFDPNQIWSSKGSGQNRYFDTTLTLGDWLPGLQQLAFSIALVWFGVTALKSVKTVFRRQVTADEESKRAWILVLWVVIPLAVYLVAGLWTYLSYYVILYPVYFVVLGALAQRAVPPKILVAGIAAFVVGNIVFMLDVNRYSGSIRWSPGDVWIGTRLQAGCGGVCRGARGRPANWSKKNGCYKWTSGSAWNRRNWTCHFWRCCVVRGRTQLATNSIMLVVDDNRTSYDASRVNFGGTGTNYGPMHVYVIPRP